jgi:SAM-dependent methyltransferase
MDNFTYFSNTYIQSFSGTEELFSSHITKAIKDLDEMVFTEKGIAVDLGCGPGAYSLALANLGFSTIHAIDFCNQIFHQDLLANNSVETHTLDIRQIDNLDLFDCDFILCTGDTILYMNDESEVLKLIAWISRALKSQGLVLFEFRDFSMELPIIERFKTTKVSTHFIKNIGLVYDEQFIHTVDVINKKVNEKWVTIKGQSKKLRLSFNQIQKLLESNGLKIANSTNINAKIRIVACKE